MPGPGFRTYVGDSVYAELHNGMVKLTTDNGFGATNTIYLDERTWEQLMIFAKKIGWFQQ